MTKLLSLNSIFSTALVALLLLALAETVCAAPALSKIEKQSLKKETFELQKRRNLIYGISLGLDGVVTGVGATLDGISDPKTEGSRAAEEKAATEAGEQVGGAIGTALNNGILRN